MEKNSRDDHQYEKHSDSLSFPDDTVAGILDDPDAAQSVISHGGYFINHYGRWAVTRLEEYGGAAEHGLGNLSVTLPARSRATKRTQVPPSLSP